MKQRRSCLGKRRDLGGDNPDSLPSETQIRRQRQVFRPVINVCMSVEALPYGKRIIPIVPRAPPIPQLPRLRGSCNLRHVPSVVMGQEGGHVTQQLSTWYSLPKRRW
jgi:hypothetical protein